MIRNSLKKISVGDPINLLGNSHIQFKRKCFKKDFLLKIFHNQIKFTQIKFQDASLKKILFYRVFPESNI